ncbi:MULTISPECIES: ribosome biogenesis factor YjgA [Thalassotalea]|uniref:Dual-action ribosomal maturation protein DarP n=1 Tax=Thalassotalea castellviae TaxID=3075612 RepID=A0ABU2ZZB1_9GAMM|nr:ribosome biogenesis factor YjgA [Thalassotalea sp. W431]MDT0603244.1 ribosome biogenesis factor YjgA [Thalassotalea sp. W431]
MPDSAAEFDEELKSKSEIKREMHQMQDFALKLVKLSKHQRSKIPFTEEFKQELILADKIQNKHEALRRHVRHMAKVLCEMDLEPINQALDVMANKHQQETAKFVHLESLRDQLMDGDNSFIEETLNQHETMERQKLRQLIRQAAKEKKLEKPGKGFRDLFTYLKEHITF